jgi:hypothetical protein
LDVGLGGEDVAFEAGRKLEAGRGLFGGEGELIGTVAGVCGGGEVVGAAGEAEKQTAEDAEERGGGRQASPIISHAEAQRRRDRGRKEGKLNSGQIPPSVVSVHGWYKS